MTMSTFKRVAVTARSLCRGDFLSQIEKIIPCTDMIILREKDLPYDEYLELARKVKNLCEGTGTQLVLHFYTSAARELGHDAIHLPLGKFLEESENLGDFTIRGVSVHSVSEAVEAWKAGATYLTAGHVFRTDCKKDLEPRGLQFLEDVCRAVPIPVYALGGINDETETEVRKTSAAGACRMSWYMQM